MKILHITSLLFITFFLVCSCKQDNGNKGKVSVTDLRFQPGQVWTFHTSPDELPDATLTIARVDFDSREGPIIYISVKGVRYNKTSQTYNFLPLSEDALNRSVVALVKTNAQLTDKELAYFQDFYETGRQGVKAGELNKCFKITVAEALEAQRKANN